MIRTFREIFTFELRQQLKSPLFWLIALAFAALAFGAASSDDIQIGGGIGNTHRNAPYVVTQMLIYFTLIGMFLVPVFVAGAALRDFDAGAAELFFATPMPRSAYLGGRFGLVRHTQRPGRCAVPDHARIRADEPRQQLHARRRHLRHQGVSGHAPDE
jgi:ABC-type transport system involved in multi-copper enzyme maturation permease subunit